MNIDDPIGIIELGNINIKCLIFKINNNNAEILSTSITPSEGIHNDTVVNLTKASKVIRTCISDSEKKALKALITTLEKCSDEMSPEDIQTLIYSTGKENGYADNLREWFKLIYEVVFGDENGPRMGFFFSFFGVNETKQLINDKIK